MTATTTSKITTDLEQFYAEVLKDLMLQERLKAATDPENLIELAVELGKEKGYSFTKEEIFATAAIEEVMCDWQMARDPGDYLPRSPYRQPLYQA